MAEEMGGYSTSQRLLKISIDAPIKRCLTYRSDHPSYTNSSVWPDNVLTVLSYFFAETQTLKKNVVNMFAEVSTC